MATYKALTGLDYGKPPKRVEAGELVGDLPVGSIKWLLEQNLIELVDAKVPQKKTAIVNKGDEE